MDEGQFSFMADRPEELSHSVYCPECFNAHIAGPLEEYNETVEQAKEILIFDKSQGKETRLIKRVEDPVSVRDCRDYDEAVMRLAFFAVKAGYNSIVDMNLVSHKVKIDGYQTTLWSGAGVPAHVTSAKLVKDRSIWSNPN